MLLMKDISLLKFHQNNTCKMYRNDIQFHVTTQRRLLKEIKILTIKQGDVHVYVRHKTSGFF